MDDGLGEAEIARELLRRIRARDSLVAYSQAITIPGAPVSEDPDEWLFKPIETAVARHHIVTMQAIERCIRSDYGRLMIFEPPGSAKSTYASVVGPTWAMGAIPGLRVLMASYSATPIIRHSKRARQIVGSPEYRAIWDGSAVLMDGSKAADEFELTNGSGLFAAGLMGGITSSRCDLGIIDDPVAGREEADSETIRAKTKAAYEDDFLTRLKPKASIIVIQTRWHQDDLAGSILPDDYDGRSGPVECRDGQTWEVLNLPAQCERTDDPAGRSIGEFLWPEWFSERHWRIYKRNPRTWNSLYQQRPTAHEGIYFKRDDFRRFNLSDLPRNLSFYMSTDWAVTEKQVAGSNEPDFTEHGIFGVTSNEDIYCIEGYSKQADTEETIPEALDLIRARKPQLWLGEKGVIENAIGPAIRQAMRKAQKDGKPAWVPREILPSVGDKVAKSSAFAGMVGAGVVYVVNSEWGDALIDQLCAFPGGRFDDKVDMCGMIGRALDKVRGKRDAVPAKKDEIVPFTRRHLEAQTWEDEEAARRRREYYS